MIRYQHPNPIKKIIYPLLGNLIPLQWVTKYNYYGGCHFYRWGMFVRRSEWFSREQIQRYQRERLKAILYHAYRHVPYYKQLFDTAGIKPQDIAATADLVKIPVLSKETIRSQSTQFLADNASNFASQKRSTGGSTGKKLVFYHDQSVRGLMNALVRRLERSAGQRMKDRYVMMRAPIGYREGHMDYEKPYQYDPLARMLEINTANLDAAHVKNALLLMKEFKAAYLHSYPSVANVMAEYILKHPDERVPLRGVILSSELVYPAMRRVSEQAFCCKAFDFYGQEEAVAWAMECEKGNLHVCYELGVLEIINNGKPCAPGETGQFVCTGLHNYSMPLIRYAIGDCGYFTHEPCSCGRQSPVISLIGGKEKDLLVTRSGVINLIASGDITADMSGIDEYQIVQETIDSMTVKIVKNTRFNQAAYEQFQRDLRKRLGPEIQMSFQFVDTIPRTEANKLKLVISKVPLPL